MATCFMTTFGKTGNTISGVTFVPFLWTTRTTRPTIPKTTQIMCYLSRELGLMPLPHKQCPSAPISTFLQKNVMISSTLMVKNGLSRTGITGLLVCLTTIRPRGNRGDGKVAGGGGSRSTALLALTARVFTPAIILNPTSSAAGVSAPASCVFLSQVSLFRLLPRRSLLFAFSVQLR
jgi:hypothetical protein